MIQSDYGLPFLEPLVYDCSIINPACFSCTSYENHRLYKLYDQTRKFSIILVSLQIYGIIEHKQNLTSIGRNKQTRNKLTGTNRQKRVNRSKFSTSFLENKRKNFFPSFENKRNEISTCSTILQQRNKIMSGRYRFKTDSKSRHFRRKLITEN